MTGPSLNILFVDDHTETCHVIGRLLTILGHHVKTAECVASALAAADVERFHLLISDIGLPDGTGNELLHELMSRGRIVGIALSGYGDQKDVHASIAGGFAEHLVKPITVEQLEAAICRVRHQALEGGGRGEDEMFCSSL